MMSDIAAEEEELRQLEGMGGNSELLRLRKAHLVESLGVKYRLQQLRQDALLEKQRIEMERLKKQHEREEWSVRATC